MNSGKERVLGVLDAKMQQLEVTMRNTTDSDLASLGSPLNAGVVRRRPAEPATDAQLRHVSRLLRETEMYDRLRRRIAPNFEGNLIDWTFCDADRWIKDDLADSRYIWLPIGFDAKGQPEIRWMDQWSPKSK